MEITGKSQEMSYTSTQESPRSMGGIQPTLMNPSPSTARQPLILEKEPMDTDSGTATGSDFGSSSPESDRSETPNLFDPEPIVKITEQMKSDENLSKLQKVPGNDDFLSGGFSPEASGSATEKIKSENDNTNCNDQDSTASKINSHGRVRKFKCKQCDFFSTDKLEYWEHIKTHMNPSKVLSCPNCPFVTEYKHHLEYHLRNHTGTKPFKCSKCAYSCVNNSMLKSHMKSHSNIYQYRCANCPFASKYCHSLKLHLRKSSHSPAMVLDPDGTPNPLPIIDVYGTRRGPEINDPGQRPASPNPDVLPVAPFPSNQLLLNAASSTGYLPFPRLLNGIPNPYIMEMDRLRRDRHAIVPNGSPPDIKKNETCYLDPSNRGAPETNDSSEEDGEENDRRFYTTIFDNVEVVDNSPMVEGDGTEDDSETLKLELLKKKQSPAMFKDQDGTPHPSPIVDVNGTRRGPKIKSPGHKPSSPNPDILPVPPFSLNQVLATAANMSTRFPGFSFYTGFLNGSSSPLMMEIERLTRKMQAATSLQYGPSVNSEENESCVLDLSKREAPNKDDSFEGRRSHPEIEETVQ